MKKTTNGVAAPIALICINKSRLKVYHKEKSPTYYLERGQEFQIELFNPTSDVVLAKVHLNGKAISQGGLVLNPGQRVFLERYLDVAKKFMFDTYEVSNTEEVRKAIEDNGDFKVEFYKESTPNYYYGSITTTIAPFTLTGGITNTGTYNTNTLSSSDSVNRIKRSGALTNIGTYSNGSVNLTNASSTFTSTNSVSGIGFVNTTNSVTTDSDFGPTLSTPKAKKRCFSKSIETGRVETGSQSNQKLEYVNKSFDYFAFHTVEYKLLPVSQKINTVEDINVKRYCPNCGAKVKKTDKFCSQCSKKL